MLVVVDKHSIFRCLIAIQPNNGVQVFQLPLAPFVQRAVHHGVVVPGVNKQHLIPQGFGLALVEEPQGTGQGFGVEKVVAHTDHHVHMTGLHQSLPDILVLAGAVRGGGGQ